jgi:tetratricopeptide (TPR) repeat protein
MPSRKGPNPFAQRLSFLAEGRSLSDIARKTGTSVANVSRYVSGTRVPAEFCTALVKGLGVNPTWLLTGEGAPNLTDIADGTVKMAGNVLELVEAMNAVAQMRLGALAGKHHLRVLRELNDALERYDKLRERLNRHSAPIFERLMNDLEAALLALNFERIAELRKAAQQVERLCADAELSRRFTALQARCEASELNSKVAMSYQQKLVRDTLATGLVESNEQCEEFVQLIVIMRGAGKVEEALRLCRALVELVGEDRQDWPSYCMLRFWHGKLLTDYGELYDGLALMQRYAGGLTERRRSIARMFIADAMLLTGLVKFDEMLHYEDTRKTGGERLVEYAIWLEDPRRIEQALKSCGPAIKQVHAYLALPDFAEFAIRAIDGDRTAPGKFAETVRRKAAALEQSLEYHCMLATLHWLAGARIKARNWTLKADRMLAEYPELIRKTQVMITAGHYRNVLRLEMRGAIRDRAEKYFRDIVKAGYRAFEEVLN